MDQIKFMNKRLLSIMGFSLFSAYLLSFLFEGQVLYGVLANHNVSDSFYILIAIAAHFLGLFSCGFLVKSSINAKYVMLGSMGLCLLATLPFYFKPSSLWSVELIVSGYAGGCAVASWGYYLKTFTPKNQRLKSCADVLIFSNFIMMMINAIAINISAIWGLSFAVLCLVMGIACIWVLPIKEESLQIQKELKYVDIKKTLAFLALFIIVITINSGLMYQVINPAFDHLTRLVSWYWVVPYIAALVLMRNLPKRVGRAKILYLGMVMIMTAFISFMLLGRGAFDYLVVNTLLLGACGIFDLFWWSIIGEMLEQIENPIKIFGVGLSANVFGVLLGDIFGIKITSFQLPDANIVVIALTVVCITLVMLPPLNHQLTKLLKDHVYLNAYRHMSDKQQTNIVSSMKTLEKLTLREEEVLQHILAGESNREIAQALFISENTVKTHVRNIFSKYDVGSRAELISNLFKNHIVS